MNDKIDMPPLATHDTVVQEPQDNYVEEEPVHKLPNEIAQAQAIQREAEQLTSTEVEERQELEEEKPIVRRNADKPTPEESFNELKRSKREMERRWLEAEDKLRAIENQKLREPEEDLNVNIAEDDYADGKSLNKIQKKIAKLEEIASEARLRSQYPDIDKVLSGENIALLRAKYPGLAASINRDPNFYTKAEATYTLIKNLGIERDIEKVETNYQNEAKIKANMAKPRPLASIAPQKADSPLSRVNAFAEGLTDDLAKQLRKEMVDAMRNR